jgi:outer membrane biogenesis lipoprotein LolB
MLNRQLRSLRFATAALALLVLPACSSGNSLGPDNDVQVSNNTDTFEWQATAMDNISQTLTYNWQNTGTTADVNQSSNITSGSGTLTVWDDAGTQVYTRTLTEDGTFTTIAGTAGTWKVEVKLSGTSGVVNFRLEKP